MTLRLRLSWCAIIAWVGVWGLSPSTAIGQTRTLFIDFNNAEREIQVFRENVRGRPSDVVVIPSYARITPAQRLAAREANHRIEANTMKVLACATASRPHLDRCALAYLEIRRAEIERSAATGAYSADDLKAELSALLAPEPTMNFDTLVISGHHETGYYRGELTQAKERELAALLTESGVSQSQFKMVVLLGCGTGTKNAYAEYLVPLFPGAILIVGAEESAPTRDEARNLAFIRKLVSVRSALLQVRTRQEVEPIYRSLLAERWPVSLLWRGRTLFMSRSVEPF
jgi:hypothetical protein